MKIWGEALEGREKIRPGLRGVIGKVETFQNQTEFVVSEYRPITIEKYRELQKADPVLARAFTMDVETLALPGFRERVGPKLKERLRLGQMRLEESNATRKTPPPRKNASTNAVRWKRPVRFTKLDGWVSLGYS